MHAEAGRPRRDAGQDARRQRQLRRLDRRDQRVECGPLIARGHGLDGLAAVAAHGVDVVDAADRRGRRFDLIPVVQVERHQHFFDQRHRLAALDGLLAESFHRARRRTPSMRVSSAAGSVPFDH